MANQFDDNPFDDEIKPEATESLLQRGIKQATKNFPPFGGMSEQTSDFMPTAGQLAGSVGGTYAGALRGSPVKGRIVGGTIGRTVGEAGRQTVKAGLGEGFDTGEIGKQAGVGGITELIGGGVDKVANAVFTGTAGKLYRGISGKRLGKALETVESSGLKENAINLWVKAQDILDKLNSQVKVVPSQNRLLQSHLDDLANTIQQKGGQFGAVDLVRSKRKFDQVLKNIGAYAKKGQKEAKGTVDYDVGDAAIQIRNVFDDGLKKLANTVSPKVGKELAGATKSFSKTAKQFPPGRKGIGGIVPDIARASAALKGFSGDIGGALKSLGAAETIEAGASAPIAYGLTQVGSKAGAAGLSELINLIRRQG